MNEYLNKPTPLEVVKKQIELLGHDAGEFVSGVFSPCGIIQELVDKLEQSVDHPKG